MKKKILGVLLTALIVVPTAALAAVKEGSFSLSPLVGGYVFGDNQQFNASPVLGVRGGYSLTKAIGVEALYDYVVPTDSKYWGIKDITMHRFGAQGLYHFMPDNQLVPYLAAGASGVKFSGSGVNPQMHLSFDYGAGAKYFVTDAIAVRADLRHVLYGYNNTSYNNVEFMLGATVQFGGVAPAATSAMTVTAAKSGPTGSVPVSEVPTKTTAVQAAQPELLACAPSVAPLVCPPPREIIKMVIAPVTREACEPFLNVATAKASAAATLTQACVVPVDSTVLFSYEKAAVKQKYYDELDKIGNFLTSNPTAKVVIEGHTSAMGDKDADLKLSQERADAVKGHLMYKFGINANRITAKGYGLTRPVASNKTTSGRMQNRRIVAVFSCE